MADRQSQIDKAFETLESLLQSGDDDIRLKASQTIISYGLTNPLA